MSANCLVSIDATCTRICIRRDVIQKWLGFTVSKSDRNLYLVLEASHEVCIRGVIAFAEGLFEGESHIWYVSRVLLPWVKPHRKKPFGYNKFIQLFHCRIPKIIEGNGDRVQIPIITEKDMANEIHIRTFLGPQES